MMGRQATKRELFVLISLGGYVTDDHLLRAVDRYRPKQVRRNLDGSYSSKRGVEATTMAKQIEQ